MIKSVKFYKDNQVIDTINSADFDGGLMFDIFKDAINDHMTIRHPVPVDSESVDDLLKVYDVVVGEDINKIEVDFDGPVATYDVSEYNLKYTLGELTTDEYCMQEELYFQHEFIEE